MSDARFRCVPGIGPKRDGFCMGIAKTTAGCEEVIGLPMMQNPAWILNARSKVLAEDSRKS